MTLLIYYYCTKVVFLLIKMSYYCFGDSRSLFPSLALVNNVYLLIVGLLIVYKHREVILGGQCS